jgi:serine/threonine protein kinase
MQSMKVGDQLGPYSVLEQIGRGGMGEVWKARDTRLDRIVAIKTSRQQFSERFEREARAVAALNHPNICTLHDVGPNYLVMEFVEGAPLKGPLPLEEVLRLGRQLTAALEAAHEKHITHRDLKPGNILLKPDGSIKVLDFGLAKIAAPVRTDLPVDESPTLTMGMTEAGMILGTAAYMAPEQAKGKEVDKRADIWAFGVVLYELVTGSRPFTGGDMPEILAAVIHQQPDLEKVPFELRRLIRKCLEKDPGKRLRDIGDVWELLEVAPTVVPGGTGSPAQAKGLPHWVAGLVTIVAGIGIWAPWRTPPPAPQIERFEIAPPDKIAFDNPIALSPDGRHLAFISAGSVDKSVWVRSLDTLQARKIAPVSGNPNPFWSPDSRFLGFQQDGKLKKVDITGGPPTTLSDAPTTWGGGAWSADNVIVFGNRSSGSLMQVPAAGGVPVALTKLDEKRGDINHMFPSFLPDQKHFVYLRRSSKAEFTGIYIGTVGVPPEQQESKLLIATANSAVYTPSPDPREATKGLGFLLFLRDSALMAQPFDADALELKGEPVPIADQVASTNYGFGRFTASLNGALAFVTGGSGEASKLTWFDREGKNLGTIGNPGRYAALAIAPDGSRVAAEKMDGSASDLWLIDAAPGGKNDRFTFDPARETSPVWSPDGTQIIFASSRDGGVMNLFQKPSNLAGKEEEVFKSPESKMANDWSRDGKKLSLSTFAADSDMWTLNLADKKPTLFFKTSVRDNYGRFSPDGRWLAYASQVTGTYEVYVRPFPANEAGGQQMVSLGGGSRPLWRRDGKELFYYSDNKVMSVEVTPGAALKFGQPKVLFTAGAQPSTDGPYYQWDATADGSRFLINQAGGETGQAAPLTLVKNWTAALK